MKGKQNALNGKTKRKASERERDDRIEWLANQIATHPLITRTEIHKVMNAKYGLCWQTVEKIYERRARLLLKQRANMTSNQARNLGINTLLDCLENGSYQIKIAAVRHLAEIFGYEAPRKTFVTTPPGEPFETRDLPKPTVEQARRWLAEDETALVSAGNGNGNGNGEIRN